MQKTSTLRLTFAAVSLLCALALSSTAAQAATKAPASNAAESPRPDNATCLECHDGTKKIEVKAGEDDKRTLSAVKPEKFGGGVHATMQCVDCHTNIVDNKAPHKKTDKPVATCVQCHETLLQQAKLDGRLASKPRLATVVENVNAYKRSFHARKNTDHPDRPNADCHECHDSHSFAVPADKKSEAYKAWRAEIPALCGDKCHEEQVETFSDSAHGKAIAKGDIKAAVCTDCHTTHEITSTSLASFKLLNPEECGECHKQNLKSYRDTYHGQVTQLGFTYTAKCFDCHGSHGILKVEDPKSKVNPDNKLKTCQSKGCHDGKKMEKATPGFVSFSPHAHAGDFKKYPEVWIASRFMVGLLIGVFAFFWLHCGLWYYREWKDKTLGKVHHQHILTGDLKIDETKQVKRFAAGWRIAHLAFALVTMTLVLTGTTALFSESVWAPSVAKALGGTQMMGVIHRIAAVLFVGIFMAHFVYVMIHLLRKKDFRWFGPDSLIPRWKDFADCRDMFKWFLGKGPRPLFDRWTYFEKFDYWAVFWGVNIIGFSGLMLALPHVTASYLPGWVFNVATLVHGEEAFLAAVFLFTVHFFNNHFRPDKLPPPDIVMFTGSQPLEEFMREHPAQYQRLVAAGELEKYLVDVPSPSMQWKSKVLGLVLIGVGLILLVLVGIGFFTEL
jgi:cytochrome b subunit of formate dehydrogenase